MTNVLKADERTGRKRSDLRELRENGGIPAIVYGYKTENMPISINSIEFMKTMREAGRNGVISLDLEGKKMNVVLHEYQEEPILKNVIHADFLAVDMSQEIDAEVYVGLSGTAAGVKEGGVTQQILHELSVTAKPNEIPEEISVDITNLEIGDVVSVGDIRKDYQVTINHEDDEAIATILAPTVEPAGDEGEAASEGEENKEDGE